MKMAKLILTPWEKICVRDSLHFNRKEILKLVKAQERAMWLKRSTSTKSKWGAYIDMELERIFLDSEEKGFPDTLPEQDEVTLNLTKDELNALYLILMEGEQCASVAFGSSFGTVSVDLGKKVQDAWKAHCWTKK